MDTDTLDKLIKEHQPLSTRKFDQKSYKIGVNAGIFQEANKPAPDNRIPVPFIWRIIKLYKGFFATIGNIKYVSDWFTKNLKDIYDANNEELQNASEFESCAAYTSGFELHWYDGKFYFEKVPIDQCIPIYSEDLRPRLVAFIWHRKTRDGRELATFYDDKEYQEYVKGKKDWKLNPEMSGNHLYGKVPVIEFFIDSDKRNAVDHLLPMQDFYDKLISSVANEHEKFSESLLLLRNAIDGTTKDDEGLTEIDKVARWRILDRLGDNVRDAAAYLERNVNDGFIMHTLETVERHMSEFAMLPGPNQDTSIPQSAKAMRLKFHELELLMADYEAYFSVALQNRIKLITGHALFSGDLSGVDSVSIKFDRNYPHDIEELIRMLTIASGGERILSNETILKQFPSTMIEDVNAELGRLKSSAPLTNPMDTTVNPNGGL